MLISATSAGSEVGSGGVSCDNGCSKYDGGSCSVGNDGGSDAVVGEDVPACC